MMELYANDIVSRTEEGYEFKITKSDSFFPINEKINEIKTGLALSKIAFDRFEKMSDEDFLRNRTKISEHFEDIFRFAEHIADECYRRGNYLENVIKERDVIKDCLLNDIDSLYAFLLKMESVC